MKPRQAHRAGHGFTLVELAVVLAIVALLAGGMLLPLAAQRDLESRRSTDKALAGAIDALLGFAAANGRLPCPASASSNGLESFCTDPDPARPCVETIAVAALGRCAHAADGFLPAATLALSPVDAGGFMIDAWNGRIRYAVSFVADPATSGAATRHVFTAAAGMRSRSLPLLAGDAQLRICPDSACATALTTQAVLAVWSSGANAAAGGSGADERENPSPTSATHPDPNANRFVSRAVAGAGAAGGEFDDLVQWLSAHVLYNRLIAAGQLPRRRRPRLALCFL